MSNDTIKQVRSLHLHQGRLSAIKYLRTACKLPFAVARLAVEDIITCKPWTRPEIKPDLNQWEQGFQIHL